MITSKDSNYKDFINETEGSNYEILIDKLKDGEAITCRDDKDMTIEKSNDGVVLTKKCFIRNCFSKAPKIN